MGKLVIAFQATNMSDCLCWELSVGYTQCPVTLTLCPKEQLVLAPVDSSTRCNTDVMHFSSMVSNDLLGFMCPKWYGHADW